MSEQSIGMIKGKISIPSSRLLLAWLMLVVFPILTSLIALDYFLGEYAYFSESGKLAEAFNEIETYKDALVVENFLESRLTALKKLTCKTTGPDKLDNLKNQIDSIIGGKSILCVFFDKNRQKLQTRQYQPADLQDIIFPPGALFKRQLQFIHQQQKQSGPVNSLHQTKFEQKRIALSMQQLFKTLTPVTIRTERITKNFSAHFGGDLYFIYFDFADDAAQPAGCLTILRGQELPAEFIKNALRREFPYCRVVNREMDIVKCETHPEFLNSGIVRYSDRILITSTADQRFIRHVLHAGGIKIKERENRNIPFLQYHLPLSSMQHHFSGMRHLLRLFAAVLLCISGLYCLHLCLFGAGKASSFKRRIMATTLIAAVFPFTFFATTFYLHTQYNEFLDKINLLQHINTRLLLVKSELEQYFARLEVTLSTCLQQINNTNLNDKDAVMRVFTNLGKEIPVTKLSLQKLDGAITKEFIERASNSGANDSNSALENFFPLRALQLVTEREPLDRTRQDKIKVPGEEIKTSIMGQTLISNGSLYNVDQSKFPVWMANVKITDHQASQASFKGFVISRFEPAPILKDFLQQSHFARSEYQEEYGNYLIKYAFFPTERTGSHFIWPGSGHTNNSSMRKVSEKQRSETIIFRNSSESEEFITSRMDQEIPHIAVALAQKQGSATSIFNTSAAISLGSIVYLALVLILTGKLLDSFFVSPVIELAKSAEQIGRGSDVWNLHLATGDEFEVLNNSFAGMVKGLQQRNMLRDYVSADAYSDIENSSAQSLAPGGEYREATILFAAIKDYQTITEGFSPSQTIELLNRFTTIGDGIVKQHGGSIDKILGQTLMFVFRESHDDKESHALRAAKTALEIAERSKTERIPGIYAGIASGTVISGKIGSYKGKLDFTVIGNPVNLAARLKTEATESNTGIIISGSTMRLLKGKGRVQFLRRCSLKGKAREYNIYELCDLR